MACARAHGRDPKDAPPFDAVIVTGDISTDATNDERFQFARQYLTSTVPVARTGVYAAQGLIGLTIDSERLFCVPGNHDKMRETTPTRFNKAFADTPAKCNYISVMKPHDMPIVLFGLDSNGYLEGNIAKGQIDEARLAWLLNAFREMENQGVVMSRGSLTVEEYDKAVRILVLHHHIVHIGPYVRRFKPSHRFTTLDGASELMDAISGRIDIVLHGHEHYPASFQDENSGALVVSAGTASEWRAGGDQNSFYDLVVRDDYSVRLTEHIWTGRGFRSDPAKLFMLSRHRASTGISRPGKSTTQL